MRPVSEVPEAIEPPILAPMLAGAVGVPDDTNGWLFEPKWDGVRAIARVWEGRITLTSRLGNDVTFGYPELAELGPNLAGRAAVLDGEIIAFDDRGRPSFERLQRRMHVRGPGRSLLAEVPVLFVVFDLLWLDGRSLIAETQSERRRALETLDPTGPSWQTSPLLPAATDPELRAACRKVGLEGYVGKLASAAYVPGKRSKTWTKVKCGRRREFVVGGWSEGSRGRSGQIGSLAVGWIDPEEAAPAGHPYAVHYAGLVGSGLSGALLKHLAAEFRKLATDTSPFANTPPGALHYLRPTVVVEVMFSEVTESGVLRQPSIKGIRNDIDAANVVWTDELV